MANVEVILLIWNHNVEDIARGWYAAEGKHVCLACGAEFEQGRI